MSIPDGRWGAALACDGPLGDATGKVRRAARVGGSTFPDLVLHLGSAGGQAGCRGAEKLQLPRIAVCFSYPDSIDFLLSAQILIYTMASIAKTLRPLARAAAGSARTVRPAFIRPATQ